MFWKASPYSWSPIGWPSDLDRITREEALAFYDRNYSPNNLTMALVGEQAATGFAKFSLPPYLQAGDVVELVKLTNRAGAVAYDVKPRVTVTAVSRLPVPLR